MIALWRDRRGSTTTECIVVIVVLALALIGAMRVFGESVLRTAKRYGACVAALDATGCKPGGDGDLDAPGRSGAPSEPAPRTAGGDGAFAAVSDTLRLGTGGDGRMCVGNACFGGNCFVAGTPVATPGGLRPIETLRAGDVVLSAEPGSGKVVTRPVTRTFVTPQREVLRLSITTAGASESVEVTPGHRFWVDGAGWTEAADLASGASGLSAGGGSVAFAGADRTESMATVYNLEVDGTHTYFVGRARVLVHNDCIEDAQTGALFDPKRRAAIEKLAEWGPYNDKTYLILANAVFGERLAKDGAKKAEWDRHQAKQITFGGYWDRHKKIEGEDWFPNSWKALRQGLFEGNRDAARAVQQLIDAAEAAGAPPDWGGERLREAKRLIARNTPPAPTGKPGERFIVPDLPKETRDSISMDHLVGIARWWSKLTDDQRNTVNEALREVKTKDKQAKLLKDLAADDVSKVTSPPKPDDGWIDNLPPPIADGVSKLSDNKRAAMGIAWGNLSGRDFDAIRSELLGMLEGRASNQAMANSLYNRLVPSNVSTSRQLRYEISLRDGEMTFPAYVELTSRQIPAMAKKEQKAAADEEADRQRDLIARMQTIMADPGLLKRGKRDAKTLEVYERSDLARTGHTALGFGKQGVDTVVGIGHMIFHPIETAKGLWFAVSNPDKSIPALIVSIDESYHDDPDQFMGRVTFEITLAAVTAGGGEAAGAADKARRLAKLAKEARDAGDLAKAIRYAEAAENIAAKAEKAAQGGKVTAEIAKNAAEARTAANSANVVAGAAKTDLVTRAERLIKLADEAYPRYAKELGPAKDSVTKALGEFGEIQARAKDPVSAANRLERAIDRFHKTVDKLDDVMPNLWDAIGTRVVLENPGNIDKLVDKLAAAIKSGELKVVEINNLHGPGGKPYFSPQQIERLQQAAKEAGKDIKINSSKVMDSGYTVVCVYLEHGGGVRGELQIIGKKALELADVEHIPYDLSLGKPLVRAIPPDAIPEMQRIVGPIEDAVRGWSKDKWDGYNAYLNEAYKHARNEELGIPSKPPKLPDGYPEVVSVDGLKKVHAEIKELKAKQGGGSASGVSPQTRLREVHPPAGALTPSQMPKKLAQNLTAAEAGQAQRYADDLSRIAGNIDKNPLGTAKELADLKWDKVKVSWDKPIEKGASEFTRLGEEAKALAKEAGVPEKAALDYLIDEKFNDMLKAQQAYFHDPRTGVTHVPRDFVVYKDGVKRPLDLSNPIERAWAERHARALVEEYAHGAGSAVRAGEYTPLTPKLQEFQKWLGDPATQPWLKQNFTGDEIAQMAGHMHEADITALLQGKSAHGPGELGRYKIREAYEEFTRRSKQPSQPQPRP